VACPGRLPPPPDRREPLEHDQISHYWHQAETAVLALDGPPLGPDTPVDALACVLATRAGARLVRGDVEAWLELQGADHARRGATTRRQVARSHGAAGAALIAAWDQIASLRAERDELEGKVAELGGARVLADELAAELERDEWIRARLRKAKATPPARALIKLRKVLVDRARARPH